MRFASALFALALLASSSLAQQAGSGVMTEDQRLGELDRQFGILLSEKDQLKAFNAEQKIWSLWMQSAKPDADKRLADGTDAMGSGNYQAADEIFTALIKDDSRYAEAWNKRATLYYLMGRLDESLADIVKVIELEPRHFGALSGRGMILAKQGKLKEAVAAYREAVAVNPHMPGVNAALKALEALSPEL